MVRLDSLNNEHRIQGIRNMICKRCNKVFDEYEDGLCPNCLKYLIDNDMYYDKETGKDYTKDAMLKMGAILMR